MALRRFVLKGDAVTLMADFSAVDDLQDGGLVSRAIAHPMFQNIHARLLVKRDRVLSPATQELLTWIVDRIPLFAARGL